MGTWWYVSHNRVPSDVPPNFGDIRKQLESKGVRQPRDLRQRRPVGRWPRGVTIRAERLRIADFAYVHDVLLVASERATSLLRKLCGELVQLLPVTVVLKNQTHRTMWIAKMRVSEPCWYGPNPGVEKVAIESDDPELWNKIRVWATEAERERQMALASDHLIKERIPSAVMFTAINVNDFTWARLVCTDEFRRRVRSEGLTGLSFESAKVQHDHTATRPLPTCRRAGGPGGVRSSGNRALRSAGGSRERSLSHRMWFLELAASEGDVDPAFPSMLGQLRRLGIRRLQDPRECSPVRTWADGITIKAKGRHPRDFAWQEGPLLITTEAAWTVLAGACGGEVQGLPLTAVCKSGERLPMRLVKVAIAMPLDGDAGCRGRRVCLGVHKGRALGAATTQLACAFVAVRGPGGRKGRLVCSDEFKRRVRAAGLTGVRFRRAPV